MCHVSNAFFSSNFDLSTTITLDGDGIEIEMESQHALFIKDKKIELKNLRSFLPTR